MKWYHKTNWNMWAGIYLGWSLTLFTNYNFSSWQWWAIILPIGVLAGLGEIRAEKKGEINAEKKHVLEERVKRAEAYGAEKTKLEKEIKS